MTEIQRRTAPVQAEAPAQEDVCQQIVRRANRTFVPAQHERVDFISSGSDLLNLALSQKGRRGGWARGRVNNIVGDGSSGKTLLALEACANAYYTLLKRESPLWPTPTKLSIVYNNVEGVMDMPIERMYGDEFVAAVEWIPEEGEKMTCEAFGRDLLGRIDSLPAGEALVYVLDSVDAADSTAGQKRMDASIKSGDELDGTFGTEKAKYFSAAFFNNLCARMAGKDVTIFLISQVREKIDRMKFGEKYYRTGGKAMDFYTHQVLWLAQIEKLKKKYAGDERVYGVTVRGRVKRNKTAVPFREADFNIIFDYGVDNILSAANYLTPEEINKLHDGKRVSREGFVDMCYSDPEMAEALLLAVEERWRRTEDNTKVVRPPRTW